MAYFIVICFNKISLFDKQPLLFPLFALTSAIIPGKLDLSHEIGRFLVLISSFLINVVTDCCAWPAEKWSTKNRDTSLLLFYLWILSILFLMLHFLWVFCASFNNIEDVE